MLSRVLTIAIAVTAAACPAPVANEQQTTPQPTAATTAATTPSALPALAGGAPAPTSSLTSNAGMPTLAVDPSGRSPMLVPSGWTVNVIEQGQQTFLRIDETPGRDDSPVLGMIAQTLQSGATAESMVQLVTSTVENGKVLASHQLAPGVALYLIEGVVNNIAAKMAVVGANDTSFAYATVFVAPSARFDALGGAQLLLAAMGIGDVQPGNPPIAKDYGGRGGATGANIDVGAYQVQMDMLAARQRVDANMIVGKWSQGTQVSMGNVYEETMTGSISYDAIGHGNFFEFRADGSYAYVHNYAQSYYSCRNSIKSGETGTYAFDGLTLTLKPAAYSAQLCSCCAGNPKTKQSSTTPVRQYEVALHPQGQHMVIRGSCPEYIISCVGEPKHQREGFYRN